MGRNRHKNKKAREEKERSMCKLFGIAGIPTPEVEELIWDLAEEITPFLARANSDGFGYAAVSGTELWGERWFNPANAWSLRNVTLPKGYIEVLEGKSSGYNFFGKRPKGVPTTAIIMHARHATGPRNLANVHPFVKDNHAFTHNGVITNKERLDLTGSDACDSMGIFNAYLKGHVMYDLSRFAEALDEPIGSQACMLLGHDGEQYYLDMWRNSGSSLQLVKLKRYREDFAFVWLTDATDLGAALKVLRDNENELIKEKKLDPKSAAWNGIYIQTGWTFEAGKVIRLSAKTGEVLGVTNFRPESYKSQSYTGYTSSSAYESKGSVSPIVTRTPAQEALAAKGSPLVIVDGKERDHRTLTELYSGMFEGAD